jgi:hypothetical protein
LSTAGGRNGSFLRYLGVLMGVLGVGLGALAAFNWLMDPFGAYRPELTRGLEPYRAYEFRRLQLGELLRHEKPEVVLLGSSRTFVGVDPRWAEWGGTVVNAGIPSATMNEVDAIARYALAQGGVKKVYLFADFFAFNDAVVSHRDFARSRFAPGFSPVAYHVRNLLTVDSLEQSMDVALSWREDRRAAEWVSGFKVRHEPPRRPDLRGDLLWSMNFYLKSPTAFPSFRRYDESLGHLRSLVRRCREGGVELTVVVLPVHALHLEVMRGAGVWEMFEKWERDVAALLEEEGRESGGAPFAFWDFTSYHGPSAEAIPRAPGPAPSMKFFRDEAHPLPKLVYAVVQRMAGTRTTAPVDNGEFGALVTTENVGAHLEEIRADREAYAQTHQVEVKWVTNLAAAAAKWNAAHPVGKVE